MKKLFIYFDLILLSASVGIFASAQKEVQSENVEIMSSASYNLQLYGSKAAEKTNDFTLEEMLRYSSEDIKVAVAQNELLTKKFNNSLPFADIIVEEKGHEALIEELGKKYHFEIPPFDGRGHTSDPVTLEETFNIGIAAETQNVAMYDKFLKQDLDDDVRVVFVELRDGTVKHLEAFKESVAKY